MAKYQFELWSGPDTISPPTIFFVDDIKLNVDSIKKMLAEAPKVKTSDNVTSKDSVTLWVTEVQAPSYKKSFPGDDKVIMSVGDYIPGEVMDLTAATKGVEDMLKKANLTYKRII